MSDRWYREPFDLPPYVDGFGAAWTWDGQPANEAAEKALNPEPCFLDKWPEDLRSVAFAASVNMEVLDAFYRRVLDSR
jgi:hypothetical protein